MKKIYVTADDTISLSEVPSAEPIFAKKDGRLAGMVVEDKAGWTTRTGGSWGVSGCHTTRKECLLKDQEYGYTFFVN